MPSGADHEKKKLTEKTIKKWTHKDGSILWDTELHGFLLKTYPSGAKAFCINYRNRYGVQRRYTIGKYGVLTVMQARGKADELLSRIKLDGIDPLEKRQATRAALTVDDLLNAYLQSGKFAEKAQSTQTADISRLKRHIRPTLGNLRLEQVTPDKVRKAFAAIRDGKTATTERTKPRGKARVRGGEGAARMAIRVLRAIYSWAITEGLTNSNPCTGVSLGSDGERDAVLRTPAEYRRLFDALAYLSKTRQIPQAAADAITVLALTGARRSEIAACRWSHVDMKRGLIVLQPHEHKTGRKTGKPREIALPSAARAIIANRPAGDPDDYVFAGRGSGHVQLSAKVWSKIRKQANLPDGIGNHALRHSLGTMLALQGAEAAQIMSALGHHQLSTTNKYIHWATDARAEFLERQTAGISGALDHPSKAKGRALRAVK